MAKKINMTPEQFVEKHARRTKNALEDVKTGVMNVTESPTAKAAAKKNKMLQNVTAAINNGKWERGLRRVSLDEWKEKFINKGIARIPAGIDASADKIRAFAGELLSYEAQLQSKVHTMPDLTLEDSVNRMVEWTRGMAKFQRK